MIPGFFFFLVFFWRRDFSFFPPLPALSSFLFETNSYFTRNGVHFGLFMSALQGQGDEQQVCERWGGWGCG